MDTPPGLNEVVDAIKFSVPDTFPHDPELRKAAPLRAGSDPNSIQFSSGSMAVFFPLRCAGRVVGVKFFKVVIPELQLRYREISDFFRDSQPDYVIRVEYRCAPNETACIEGRAVPFLKMEFAEGENLKAHVESLVRRHDVAALRALADEAARILLDMERRGFAHGDLQSENILVDSRGRIRLIDLDCAYVPAFARRNLQSPGLGVPGWQHPGRRDGHAFDARIDRFSGLVLYLSLRALAVCPDLYKSSVGDFEILLNREDYENPAGSARLAAVRRLPDPEVQRFAQALAHAAKGPLERVPCFSIMYDPEELRRQEQVALRVVRDRVNSNDRHVTARGEQSILAAWEQHAHILAFSPGAADLAQRAELARQRVRGCESLEKAVRSDDDWQIVGVYASEKSLRDVELDAVTRGRVARAEQSAAGARRRARWRLAAGIAVGFVLMAGLTGAVSGLRTADARRRERQAAEMLARFDQRRYEEVVGIWREYSRPSFVPSLAGLFPPRVDARAANAARAAAERLNNAKEHVRRGEELLRSGRLGEARESFAKCAAISTSFENGRPERIVRDLDRREGIARERASEAARLEAEGRTADAADGLREAEQAWPGQAGVREAVGRLELRHRGYEAALERARGFERDKRPGEALAAYVEAQGLWRPSAEAADGRVRVEAALAGVATLVGEARSRLAAHDYAAATSLAQKALEQVPDEAGAREVFGEAREKNGRVNSLLEAARQAQRECRPDAAASAYAALLRLQPGHRAAEAELAGVREVRSKCSALLSAAEGAFQGGDYAEARRLSAELLALNRDDAAAEKLRADCAARLPPPGMVRCPAAAGFDLGLCDRNREVLRSAFGDIEESELADETPERGVTVAACFMAVHEVTNCDFAGFLNASGGADQYVDLGADGGIEKTGEGFRAREGLERHPVVNVSWHGAKAYCAWLGEKLPSHVFRLPTEAEWEAAASLEAKSGSKRLFPWGGLWAAGAANCGSKGTRPAGSFEADISAAGCRDMGGNVAEWCEDVYRPRGGEKKAQDHAAGGLTRVVRGGSWLTEERAARTTYRQRLHPDERRPDVGFRVVAVAAPRRDG